MEPFPNKNLAISCNITVTLPTSTNNNLTTPISNSWYLYQTPSFNILP